jgi:RNA polymerase sigma-70 factor, ECF subfamily
VIHYRFGHHSEVMSLAQCRALAEVAQPAEGSAQLRAGTMTSGTMPAGTMTSGTMPAETMTSGTMMSGLANGGHGQAVPVASSATDSGAIPVGTVDWTAEAIQVRVHQLVTEHVDFVWRSLRALGVPAADCDDGCQKVWWVIARKVASIEPGKERSFIFSVVMRVASDMRRSAQAQRKGSGGESLPLDNELVSAEPSAEELCDRQKARVLLERMLTNMPWEQRVVFMMFEVEELGLQEIADALGVPRGTVASRLRLAREAFNRALVRHQERTRHAAVSQGPVSQGPVSQGPVSQGSVAQGSVAQGRAAPLAGPTRSPLPPPPLSSAPLSSSGAVRTSKATQFETQRERRDSSPSGIRFTAVQPPARGGVR